VAVELNKVIRETLTLLDHQLVQAGIQVKLALDENLPRIKGNPGKLQQVFLNLFLNARDAMESGGALALSTSSAEGLVRVTVADSGAGIVRENLERIFDPFFTTKMAKKGTGLGLSVSYGIVREHGGDIEVASELGAGTRFTLSFPEAPIKDAPIRDARPVRKQQPANGNKSEVTRLEPIPAEPLLPAAMAASAMTPMTSMTSPTQAVSASASAPVSMVGLTADPDRMMR
jgi:hypothetical protein